MYQKRNYSEILSIGTKHYDYVDNRIVQGRAPPFIDSLGREMVVIEIGMDEYRKTILAHKEPLLKSSVFRYDFKHGSFAKDYYYSDHHIFDILLKWIYTEELPPLDDILQGDVDPLNAILLYSLAEKHHLHKAMNEIMDLLLELHSNRDLGSLHYWLLLDSVYARTFPGSPLRKYAIRQFVYHIRIELEEHGIDREVDWIGLLDEDLREDFETIDGVYIEDPCKEAKGNYYSQEGQPYVEVC